MEQNLNLDKDWSTACRNHNSKWLDELQNVNVMNESE